MRKNSLITFSAALLCIVLFACEKIGLNTPAQSVKSSDVGYATSNAYSYIDSFSTVDNNNDSTEKMTMLGNHLGNTYLLPI